MTVRLQFTCLIYVVAVFLYFINVEDNGLSLIIKCVLCVYMFYKDYKLLYV